MDIYGKIKKIAEVIVLNKIKIILWLVFYCGIVFGCLLSPFEFDLNIFSHNVMNFNNLSLLFTMISYEILTMFLLFLSSLTFFGLASSFVTVFLKGLGIGIILSNLYSMFIFKGVFFGIFIFLPGVFISSASIVCFASEVFDESLIILKKIIHTYKLEDSKDRIKSYIKKFSQSLCVSLLGTILTFLLCCSFSKFFDIKI